MSGKYDGYTYEQAAHALQSAIAMLMQHNPKLVEPKHLRVGLDCRAADAFGLAILLVEKGVFTKEEYAESIRKAMIHELEATAKTVADAMGLGPDQELTFG